MSLPDEQPVNPVPTGGAESPLSRKNNKEIIAPVQEVAQINKKLPKGYSYVLVGSSSQAVYSEDSLPSKRERKKTNYAEVEASTQQEPGKEKRPRGRPRKNSLIPAPVDAIDGETLPPPEANPTEETSPDPMAVSVEAPVVSTPVAPTPTVEIAPTINVGTSSTSVTVTLGTGFKKQTPVVVKTPGRKKGSKSKKKDSDADVSDDDEFAFDDLPAPKRSKPSVKTRLSDSKPGRRKSLIENETQALQQCRKILMTVRKHQWAGPFLVPVDPVLLQIPDYFTIIKHPMDLGTILNNLDKGFYTSHDEFADDMRLVWQNAMTYNPRESQVHTMAQTLSKLFEDKYKKLESSVIVAPPKVSYTPPPKQEKVQNSPLVATPLPRKVNNNVVTPTADTTTTEERPAIRMYGDVSSEELQGYMPPQPSHTNRPSFESKASVEMEKMVRELKESLKVVREEIQKLRKEKQVAVPVVAAPPPPPPVAQPHRGPGRPPGKSLASRDMTYEEKQQLTQSVKLLTEENLQTVINIIQSSMPHLTQGQEELEVDLDALDTPTLRRLEKFIKGVLKSETKKKKPPKTKQPDYVVETPSKPTPVSAPRPAPVTPTPAKSTKEGSSSDSDSSSSSSSSSSDSESSADEKAPKPMEVSQTAPTASSAPAVSQAQTATAPVAEAKDSEPQVLKPETKEVEIKNLASWSNFDVPETTQGQQEQGTQDNSWMQYQNMNQQKKQKEKERQELEERERKERAEREAERRRVEELRQKQLQEEEEKRRQLAEQERERAEKALQEQRERERLQREQEAKQQQRRFQEESDINSTLAELEQSSKGVSVLDIMNNLQNK